MSRRQGSPAKHTPFPGGGGLDCALAALLQAAGGMDADGGGAEQIRHAYQIAERWHRGQRRRSGDPYITHPLAVAQILADLGAATPVLCAALLHDVPEDTPCTLAELRGEVGAEVTDLVEQVIQMDKARYRSMDDVVATARALGDDRVVTIKLADRLHNMRTLSYLAPAKQQRKSREVLEAFAPLARELGMKPMERELTDLAIATLTSLQTGQYPSTRAAYPADPAMSRRLLGTTAALLPAAARQRWLAEWTGELWKLTTRRSRARFTISMIVGMPHLATTLRGPVPAPREDPQ